MDPHRSTHVTNFRLAFVHEMTSTHHGQKAKESDIDI